MRCRTQPDVFMAVQHVLSTQKVIRVRLFYDVEPCVIIFDRCVIAMMCGSTFLMRDGKGVQEYRKWSSVAGSCPRGKPKL